MKITDLKWEIHIVDLISQKEDFDNYEPKVLDYLLHRTFSLRVSYRGQISNTLGTVIITSHKGYSEFSVDIPATIPIGYEHKLEEDLSPVLFNKNKNYESYLVSYYEEDGDKVLFSEDRIQIMGVSGSTEGNTFTGDVVLTAVFLDDFMYWFNELKGVANG